MLQFFDGINQLAIEFDRDGSGSTVPGSTVITVIPGLTSQTIANAVRATVAGSGLSITLTDLGTGPSGEVILHVAGVASHSIDLGTSRLNFANRTPTEITAPGAGVAVQVPSVLQVRVPNTGGSGINDGDRFTLADGINPPVTFEFDRGGGVVTGNRRVVFGLSHTMDTVANSIVSAIQLAVAEGALSGLAPINRGGGTIDLRGSIFHKLDTTLTTLTQTGPVADGDSFAISDGVNQTIVFEFDDGSGAGSNVPVAFQLSDSADEITNAIVTAIKDRVSNLVLTNIDPINVGGGVIDLRAGVSVTAIFANSPLLTQTGSSGGVSDGQTFTIDDGVKIHVYEFDRNGKTVLGNVPVSVTANATPAQIASAITNAINSSEVMINVAAIGGGKIRIEGGDDDGVSFDGILSPGMSTPITVTTSGAGFLSVLDGFQPRWRLGRSGRTCNQQCVGDGWGELVIHCSSIAVLATQHAPTGQHICSIPIK